MIEWMFEAWPWIAAASVVVGIITVIIAMTTKNMCDKQKRVVIITSIILGCMIAFLCLSAVISIEFVRVPCLYGMTFQEAKYELEKIKLGYSFPFGEQYSNDDDRIIKYQYYESNIIVKKGTEIQLSFNDLGAKANETHEITVPDLVGRKYIDAVNILSETGLLHRITGQTGDLNTLYVASQSIPSRLSVPSGSIISLELTNANAAVFENQTTGRMVNVPNLINMEEKAATKLLLEKEFAVSVQNPIELDDSLAHYYIIAQSIRAGEEVPVGTQITLEKSSVKVGIPVVVPNLIGMEQKEAAKALINRGLSFQVWLTFSENTAKEFYVVGQSIEADSQVLSGTIIRLELSSKKP